MIGTVGFILWWLSLAGLVFLIWRNWPQPSRRLIITRSTDVRDGPAFCTWQATEVDDTWLT